MIWLRYLDINIGKEILKKKGFTHCFIFWTKLPAAGNCHYVQIEKKLSMYVVYKNHKVFLLNFIYLKPKYIIVFQRLPTFTWEWKVYCLRLLTFQKETNPNFCQIMHAPQHSAPAPPPPEKILRFLYFLTFPACF